jgi:NADPH:quinone reductase-like Zn-dependent oxidoreductase
VAKAVRFDQYGDVDVLYLADVPVPTPGPGQVLVQVVATSINPGEMAIRSGAMHEMYPGSFPSGEGSDFAGRVVSFGAGVADVSEGEEVIGYSLERSAHAEYVLVPADQLTPKPAGVSWEAAGALYVAGATAYAAVSAVGLREGDTVVVSGAAGGVGSLAIQLARRAGARVIGIAGAGNADWLREQGVEPVTYGDGLADRLRAAAPDGVDAFVDTFGDGYVALALELGVAADRIDTIIDFQAAAEHGVKADGSMAATSASVLAELAALLADGSLTIPIAATYPLDQVRAAYTELADRHTRGKIVLKP